MNSWIYLHIIFSRVEARPFSNPTRVHPVFRSPRRGRSARLRPAATSRCSPPIRAPRFRSPCSRARRPARSEFVFEPTFSTDPCASRRGSHMERHARMLLGVTGAATRSVTKGRRSATGPSAKRCLEILLLDRVRAMSPGRTHQGPW
jgi:hypothetical protein